MFHCKRWSVSRISELERLYSHDCNITVPPKPSDVSVQEEEQDTSQIYDVTVSWEAPPVQPPLYQVQLISRAPKEEPFIIAQKNVTGVSQNVTV